jgi:hypothetical protein
MCFEQADMSVEREGEKRGEKRGEERAEQKIENFTADTWGPWGLDRDFAQDGKCVMEKKNEPFLLQTQANCPHINIVCVSVFLELVRESNTMIHVLLDTLLAHSLNRMEERHPYLDAEDLNRSLPPSSPPIVQPSSPLTVLDELQDHLTTMHTSSPLSSLAESPALHSLVLPTSSLTESLLLNVGGSEDSFIPSSPIRSRSDLMQKVRKRQDEERGARARQSWEDAEMRRTVAFSQCLKILSENKLTLAELTEYVLFQDSSDQAAKGQYESFVADKRLITRMLTLFASSKVPKLCQRVVKDWANSTVQQVINKEVNAATRSGDLRITDREINSSFASSIGFEELKAMVRRHCPSFLGLLVNVITTDRQVGSASTNCLAAKEHVSYALVTCDV